MKDLQDEVSYMLVIHLEALIISVMVATGEVLRMTEGIMPILIHSHQIPHL